MTPAEMESRIVRYGDLQPCKTAFIDAHTPGSDQKENFTIIGGGVSESPDQHVHIGIPHGFNIGAAGQPPHLRNSLHDHHTAEVFFVLKGRWRFFWGRWGDADEVKSKRQGELEKDIANLKAAMAEHGVERGFMNAASPGVISLFLLNDFYKTREEYLTALADAMKAEYETIVASGLDLQLDCPDLALSRHMLFNDLSDDEFLKIAASHVEALNYALSDVPAEKVRVHICWGNYDGPHVCDIPMAKMFDTLMSMKSQYALFETSNPRHGHEWAVFRDRAKDIPDNKVLVPGVVDTTTNFVEHPDLVAERISRFVDIVGADRVIAGSDRGFGTFAGFGAVDPEIAYAKLGVMAEGAAKASR